VLKKGLKFCPTNNKPINLVQAYTDFNIFSRRVRLAHHFHNLTEESEDEIDNADNMFISQEQTNANKFKEKSGWTPPVTHHREFEYFLSNIDSQMQTTAHNCKKPKHQNFNKKEWQAMTSLHQNTEIVIQQAGKGGAVVILNRAEYINECLRQLKNRKYYLPTPTDLTKKHASEVENLLKHCRQKGTIDQDTYLYLKNKHHRRPTFYILPKIHKPDRPGRPIISAIDSPTDRISQYVDHHLNKLAKAVSLPQIVPEWSIL